MKQVAQNESLLSFVVGPYRLCVPAIEAQSIIEVPEMNTIPLMSPSITGVFLFRDQVTPVIDLRSKLGLPRDSNLGQLIVTTIRENTYGFWVDAVEEIILASAVQWGINQGSGHNPVFIDFGINDETVFVRTNFRLLFEMTDNEEYITKFTDFIEKFSSDDEAKKEPETNQNRDEENFRAFGPSTNISDNIAEVYEINNVREGGTKRNEGFKTQQPASYQDHRFSRNLSQDIGNDADSEKMKLIYLKLLPLNRFAMD